MTINLSSITQKLHRVVKRYLFQYYARINFPLRFSINFVKITYFSIWQVHLIHRCAEHVKFNFFKEAKNYR